MNKVIEAIMKYTREKPCKAFCDWLKENGIESPKEAWGKCDRPDWMFWIVGHKEENKPDIILAACDIAASVLHLVPEGEDRPRKAIDVAREIANGEIANAGARGAGSDAAYCVSWAGSDAAKYARSAVNVSWAAAHAAWAAVSTTANSAATNANEAVDEAAKAMACATDCPRLLITEAWDAQNKKTRDIIIKYFTYEKVTGEKNG
jgi:hypothetical protein